MKTDTMLVAITLVAWLILVGSGIWRRGEPREKLIKQGLIWIVILGAAWAVASLVLRLR